jgi:hypothetical protein
MKRIRPPLLLALCAFCALVSSGGCTRKPPTPTEAESRASELLNATFVARNQEYWYGLEKIGSTLRIVEFHRPAPALLPQTVSETSQMNGITERYDLTFTAAQYRYWNGNWSEWHQGIEGGGALVNAFTGGLGGFWTAILEKKHGQWQIHTLRGMLIQDRPTLTRLIQTAGKSK